MNIPTWENKSDTIDFCSCEHCRSTYSPAAYLVGLLMFLEKREKNGITALEVLFKRRSDIGKIELSCKNTNTIVPYIDLVNEILENFLADSAAVPQTRGLAVDLRVQPEQINLAAYEILETTDLLWTLPFSLWTEEARLYLSLLGVSRDKLMYHFSNNLPNNFPEDLKLAIAREQLGLTVREARIITGEIVTGTVGWGVPRINSLRKAKILLEKADMKYPELQQLLNTKYINGGGALKPELRDNDLDLSSATIPSLQLGHINRIQSFMRLQRKLGWEMHELDLAIETLSSGAINNEFLTALAIIKKLYEQLKTPVLMVLSWWKKISTYQPKEYEDHLLPSLYDKLFLNNTVGEEKYLEKFNLNAARDDLANPNEKIDDHKVAILEAFQLVNSRDLELLRSEFMVDDNLNLQNLSKLYGAISFAHALKISVEEMLYCRSLIGLDLLDDKNPEDSWRFWEVFEIIVQSKFSIPELAYLLQHNLDAARDFAPDDRAINVLLKELRAGLRRIKEEFGSQPNLTGKSTSQMLETVLPENLLPAAMTIIYGIPNDNMSANTDELIDECFRSFIKDLSDLENKLIDKDHEDYLDPKTKQKERLALIQQPLAKYLREKHSILLIKEMFADFLKIDFRASDKLLGELIKAITDTSLPASSEFLNNLFIDSSKEEAEENDFRNHYKLIRRLHKVATIVSRLGIPSDELEWLIGSSPQLGWLNMNDLPLDFTGGSLLFESWLKMTEAIQLEDTWPIGEPTVFELLRVADRGGGPAEKESFIKIFSTRTCWNTDDIRKLFDDKHFNLDFNTDFKGKKALEQIVRFDRCRKILKNLGVPACVVWKENDVSVIDWTSVTVTREIAAEIKQTARAKFKEDKWNSVAEGIRGILRDQQRNALVSAALGKLNLKHPAIAQDDDLFGFFLIDIEMSRCQLTSRIKAAISSVQLFIQRSFLNLEHEVDFGSADAEQWKRIKSYRVWETNRKEFLYPEN